MKLSAYAKKIGVSYLTAYRYFKTGIIQGKQLSTGTILIEDNTEEKTIEKQVEKYNKCSSTKKVALYARVSSSENKDNLDSQLQRIRTYSIAKGYTVIKEVAEIGSGVNSSRKKLLKLLKNNDWEILIVEHKDRLARFGIEIIENLLEQLNKKIEIINIVTTDTEDIIQDLVSIITSFSAKIYGKRRTQRKTEAIIDSLNNGREEGRKGRGRKRRGKKEAFNQEKKEEN